MKDLHIDALARLRAADPVVTPPDPRDPYARAMLDRVLTGDGAPPPARSRWAGRRAVGLTAAAVAGVLAVWFGQPAAAYTVDLRTDGSVVVSFRAAELRDPAKLNEELARAGARTVVLAMVPADRCPAPVPLDDAFRLPDAPTPAQLAAQRAKMPIDYELRGEGVYVIVKPRQIPAGDTLVIGYAIMNLPQGPTTMVRPVVVLAVPPCLAVPTPPARR